MRYVAGLVDVNDPGGDPEDTLDFDAPTDEEAKVRACQWAKDHSPMIKKILMLIVKQPYDPNSRAILNKRIEVR